MPNISKLILYASYQVGENLPGYVRFALKHLAETDFHVVLLTNKRNLSKATQDFLKDNKIELFLTENRGFDFGMWRRYLKSHTAHGLQNLERLLLVNDSIVYYRDNFKDFIGRAEECVADVVSLTENCEVRYHLQSFFLYVKRPALGAVFLHIMETPEQGDFYNVVRKLEIGLSETFEEAEIQMDSLFHTRRNALFAYPELIRQGAGFIKRKLLQRRFGFKEKAFFIRHKGYESLNANYHKMIMAAGLAPDFKEEWLPSPLEGPLGRAADFLWEKPFQIVGWPLLKTAIKAKYKILGKKLEGEEYG